jgi:hypothetical protein
MEYISEQARWRAFYRTLPQWVAMVSQASACSTRNARLQIVDGLFDGRFAVRWADQGKIPFLDPNDRDRPPPKGNFWRKAQINWRAGKVLDDWGMSDEGRAGGLARWRVVLLVPRGPSVFEDIWRSSRPFAISAAAATPSNVVGVHARSKSEAATAETNRRGRAGRKPGSGSIDDLNALRKMLSLLAAGKVSSVHAAANAVAPSNTPNQSLPADIARLRRKFAKRWGTGPPRGKTWTDVERELNTN